jgi:hypothetical protein
MYKKISSFTETLRQVMAYLIDITIIFIEAFSRQKYFFQAPHTLPPVIILNGEAGLF